MHLSAHAADSLWLSGTTSHSSWGCWSSTARRFGCALRGRHGLLLQAEQAREIAANARLAVRPLKLHEVFGRPVEVAVLVRAEAA